MNSLENSVGMKLYNPHLQNASLEMCSLSARYELLGSCVGTVSSSLQTICHENWEHHAQRQEEHLIEKFYFCKQTFKGHVCFHLPVLWEIGSSVLHSELPVPLPMIQQLLLMSLNLIAEAGCRYFYENRICTLFNAQGAIWYSSWQDSPLSTCLLSL